MLPRFERLLKLITIFIVVALFSASCVRPLSLSEQMARQRKVDTLLVMAVQAFRRKNLKDREEARSALSLAYELAPNDPRVIDGIGCLAWREGSFELAEANFKKAIQLNRDFARGYVHLALVAEKKGEIKRAKQLLQKALAINPLNYRARNNYASLLYDYSLVPRETAYRELMKAVSAAPKVDRVLEYNIGKMGY